MIEKKKTNDNDSIDELSHFPTSKIIFKCKFETAFGQSLYIVGNIKEMGGWEPTNSISLSTNNDTYPTWVTSEILVPVGSEIDYKYLIKDQTGNYLWEYLPQSQNRHIDIKSEGKFIIQDEKDNNFSKITKEKYKKSSSGKKSLKDLLTPKQNKSLKEIVTYDNNLIKNANNELFDLCLSTQSQKLTNNDRIVIASALLPFEIVKNTDSNSTEKYVINTLDENLTYLILYEIKEQKFCEVVWVGMLKNIFSFDEDEQEEICAFLEEKNIFVVRCTEKEYKDYWSYMDEVISPIFIDSTIDTKNEYFLNYEKYFTAYHNINRLFGDAIHNSKQENDLIMINDINLALVPNALMQKNTNAKVGIYFHIFFPCSDVIKSLPFHHEIIKSILLCDVIGFQVFHYARNFITILNRDFGLYYEIKLKGIMTINYLGRYIILHVKHPGIDLQIVKKITERKGYSSYIEKYQKIIGNKFSLISIDNPYELGQLLIKLEAYKMLLDTHPDLYKEKKMILIQIITYEPGKVDERKQEMIKRNIQEIIDTYGKDAIYFEEFKDNSFSVEEQLALFNLGNILLILQLWRGLCTLANQFIAIKEGKEQKCGLIIGETIGVSTKIKTAIRVNPYCKNELVKRIFELYTVPAYHNSKKYESDLKFIKENSTFHWIKAFFSDIKRITSNNSLTTNIGLGMGLNYRLMKLNANFSLLSLSHLFHSYYKSSKRVFFLDYENTLQTTVEDIGNETLEKNMCITAHRPTQELLSILSTLLSDPKNVIYIVTGREKYYLDEWFGSLKEIGLGAEYGFFYKECHSMDSSQEYKTMFQIKNWSWKETVRRILQGFTEKTEGSVLKEKESSLSWFYKNCNPDFGHVQANEIATHLLNLIEDANLDVVIGKDYVEIKPKNVNKGYFISHILQQEINSGVEPDFVFAIGDDISDEEMFKYLNCFKKQLNQNNKDINIYTVTVGKKPSAASYYVNEVSEIVHHLGCLARGDNNIRKNSSVV